MASVQVWNMRVEVVVHVRVPLLVIEQVGWVYCVLSISSGRARDSVEGLVVVSMTRCRF